MRKIDDLTQNAVRNYEVLKTGNTVVSIGKDYRDGDYVGKNATVYLHGNWIYECNEMGDQVFSLAGWNTPTTRKRINAVAQGFGITTIGSRPWVYVGTFSRLGGDGVFHAISKDKFYMRNEMGYWFVSDTLSGEYTQLDW